jgi:hypothetical protein
MPGRCSQEKGTAEARSGERKRWWNGEGAGEKGANGKERLDDDDDDDDDDDVEVEVEEPEGLGDVRRRRRLRRAAEGGAGGRSGDGEAEAPEAAAAAASVGMATVWVGGWSFGGGGVSSLGFLWSSRVERSR